MKTRIKSTEEMAQENEYYRRRNFPGVDVRRMYDGRTADQFLSHTGREIGSKHELTTQWKVTSCHYLLPQLPTDLVKP